MKKLLSYLTILISSNVAAGEWIQVKDSSVTIEVDPIKMESKLWDYIALNSTQQFLPRNSYMYQYKTINDSELYINALCDDYENDNLSERFIIVFDGGSCYFQAVYNFKNNEFIKLEVNGEA